MAVIAVIAAVVALGGFFAYWQMNKGPANSNNPIVTEDNGNGDTNPDVGTIVGDNQPVDPGSISVSGTGISEGAPDFNGKTETCPMVAAPGPDFCPGGEIMAKAEGDCVVGYECNKSANEKPDTGKPVVNSAAIDDSCANDSDCLDNGCGVCVNDVWSASCDAAYETKINCPQDCGQAIADKSCAAKADCVDDGTTCHVCVNAAWLKQNPEWSTKYACDGIGVSICECKKGGCVAIGE